MLYLGEVKNDFNGFQNLISFHEKIKDLEFDKVAVNINGYFVANLSVALGAILEKSALKINDIQVNVKNSSTQTILQKNQFLTYFGYSPIVDNNNTTITYRKFQKVEAKTFMTYVVNELISKEAMPSMSTQLKLKIITAFGEIFANSSMHTLTPFIFACGQFFPNLNQLDFSIADIGDGIRNKVANHLNREMSSIDAIKWALVDGNTTKQGTPGGFGLTILRDLITLNKGFMQIVSNDGFYQLDCNGETYNHFKGEFPGTIINLQFRTNDTASYKLKNE